MNSQCCLNALHEVGRYLLVQSIFGAESPSMSSLSSDEGFSESLLSFSAVLTFVFWRNSNLTPDTMLCTVSHDSHIESKTSWFIASHDAYRTFVIACMTISVSHALSTEQKNIVGGPL